MVREGVNGAWRAATPRSATHFEARVNQAYSVMGVCDDDFVSFVSVESRTPAEDPNFNLACTFSFTTPPHRVLGSMVQPGSAVLNGARRSSTVGNWPFEFRVDSGTYDLISSSADRVALRRGLSVTGNSTSFTFWVPLKSFTFPTAANPVASWRARDTLGIMDISIFEDSGSETRVTFSKAYLAATGLSSFSFHFNAPGFLPEWQPDLTSGHVRDLFLQDIDTHVKTRTLQETIDGPSVAASSGLEAAKERARAVQQRRTY